MIVEGVGWTVWTTMWKWKLPPKIKHFFWQVCSGLLPTKINLKSRKVNCSSVCGLCGEEEESLQHLFISCRVSKEAWAAVDWSWSASTEGSFLEQVQREFTVKKEDGLCKMIWGCWGLWCERNKRVWEGVEVESKSILVKARVFVEGWILAQKPSLGRSSSPGGVAADWRKPPQGRLKLNIDAAVRSNRCGLGGLVRNDAGEFVAGFGKIWQGRLSPLESELLAIREALSWIKGKGWDSVDVESDSLGAIKEIIQSSSVSSLGVIVGDIRLLFSDISFSYIRRSANRAAHGLARTACSMSDCVFWDDFPPSCISHVLSMDSINDS
ncbi:unnamed protein product [Cuscuta epithymum]|uniref:RNase H type-1 domain-containing protein n=1 Tax=Cuscuta epithymum TaxID=186058 RepID=A0AAV0FPV9_9ASTE|nr:unnamed protein product [Cuscuta epithymum]